MTGLATLPTDIIKTHLESKLQSLIDVSDLREGPGKENHFYSRAVAAYALSKTAGLTIEEASLAVVDGGDDNGIDAIHFDNNNHILWLVQSKFPQSIDATMRQDAALKTVRGARLLLRCEFESFNEKVKAKAGVVEFALTQPSDLRVILLFVTAGSTSSPSALQPADEFVAEANAQNKENWVSYQELTHQQLLDYVDKDKAPQKRDVDLELQLWNETPDSQTVSAVYGQVSGDQIAKLIEDREYDLFYNNIRTYLGGDTEVNAKIAQSLLNEPEAFFFMNNGITALCSEIKKSKRLDAGQKKKFSFADFKIINGAQTAGTILRCWRKDPVAVSKAMVYIKIVSIDADQSAIGQKITIATNTQNRIVALDFASLDPLQVRMERDLQRSYGISYLRMRGEEGAATQTTISMEDAGIALSCLDEDVKTSAQVKREKSRLWESTESGLYKTVFPRELSTKKLVNAVFTWTQLREFLKQQKPKNSREKGFVRSADYFLLHILFRTEKLYEKMEIDPPSFEQEFAKSHANHIQQIYSKTWATAESDDYKSAQLPRLFITPSRVADLKQKLGY